MFELPGQVTPVKLKSFSVFRCITLSGKQRACMYRPFFMNSRSALETSAVAGAAIKSRAQRRTARQIKVFIFRMLLPLQLVMSLFSRGREALNACLQIFPLLADSVGLVGIDVGIAF